MRKILLASAFFAPLFFGAAHAQAPVVGPCYNGVSCNLGAITAPTMTLNGTGTALSVTNSAEFGAGGSAPVTVNSGGISEGGAANFGLTIPSAHNFITLSPNGDIVRFGDPGASITGFLTVDAAASDNPISINTSNSSFAGTAINVSFSNPEQQIVVTQAISGNSFTVAPDLPFNCGGNPGFFLVCNNGDALAASSSNAPYSLNVVRDFGGSGTTGGRVAANFSLELTANTSDTVNQFYQAGNFSSTMEANAGGTSSTYAGSNFGAAIYAMLNSGATYFFGNVGLDIGLSIATGASATYLDGIEIQLLSTNTVPPTSGGTAYSTAAANGATATFTCGFCVGRPDSHNSLAASATFAGFILESGDTSPTWTNGIDLHQVTFTGNTWNDGHVTISGTGDSLLNSATPLSTTATAGFVHLPNSAGAPTGTPATISGDACEINTSTETLNCYIGSSWYHVALTSGAG